VDLVRAYEGILLGLVVVVLAAALSGGEYSVAEFGAVLVFPGVLMLVFMHLGSPPLRLFAVRALGAVVGWGLIWLVFIPLFVLLYYAVFPATAAMLVYAVIAILDGFILGLSMFVFDRVGRRGLPVSTARE